MNLNDRRVRLNVKSRLVPLWHELVTTYATTDIDYPRLRLITLAQWAIESHWATSELAIRHNNFGGIKYRDRMAAYGSPAHYVSRVDGPQNYCRFSNIKSFIRGYWHFIRTGPYRGWEEFGNEPLGFIGHLKKVGYAEAADYLPRVQRVYEGFLEDIGARASGTDELAWIGRDNRPQ
jgi:hypothetical protein